MLVAPSGQAGATLYPTLPTASWRERSSACLSRESCQSQTSSTPLAPTSDTPQTYLTSAHPTGLDKTGISHYRKFRPRHSLAPGLRHSTSLDSASVQLTSLDFTLPERTLLGSTDIRRALRQQSDSRVTAEQQHTNFTAQHPGSTSHPRTKVRAKVLTSLTVLVPSPLRSLRLRRIPPTHLHHPLRRDRHFRNCTYQPTSKNTRASWPQSRESCLSSSWETTS